MTRENEYFNKDKHTTIAENETFETTTKNNKQKHHD